MANIDRRTILVAGSATLLGAAVGVFDDSVPPAQALTTSTLFGAYCGPKDSPSSESKPQMRARVTNLLGGMPVERLYDQGNWNAPNVGHPTIYTRGVNPASVTSGSLNGAIDSFLRAVAATGHKMWFGLNHEADLRGRYSGAAQVAAHRHIQARRNALGISRDKIAIGQITTSFTLFTSPSKNHSYRWAEEDFRGFDCYLRPATVDTTEKAFGPIIADAKAAGKPIVIGEMAMGAQGTGLGYTDAQWTTQVQKIIAALKAGNCAAATWFHCVKREDKGLANWQLTPHSGALAAYRQAVISSLD
jgi:hypothetical protein